MLISFVVAIYSVHIALLPVEVRNVYVDVNANFFARHEYEVTEDIFGCIYKLKDLGDYDEGNICPFYEELIKYGTIACLALVIAAASIPRNDHRRYMHV